MTARAAMAGYAKTPESQVRDIVLDYLRRHPQVAWIERMNSGAFNRGSRFVRFGFKGCADILGQLKDGRFLAVELKAGKERATPEQEAFIERVRSNGGVAGIARGIDDCEAILGQEDACARIA